MSGNWDSVPQFYPQTGGDPEVSLQSVDALMI